MKKTILLVKQMLWLFGLLLTSSVFAQSIPITGKITEQNGEGLLGASVVVENTTNGAITDIDGKFSLNVPDKNSVLVISFVGYETQKVSLGNRTFISVVLTTGKALDEVVVIGYGSVKKSDLTGSVSSIKADELKKTPNANFVQGLQAKGIGCTGIAKLGRTRGQYQCADSR